MRHYFQGLSDRWEDYYNNGSLRADQSRRAPVRSRKGGPRKRSVPVSRPEPSAEGAQPGPSGTGPKVPKVNFTKTSDSSDKLCQQLEI